MKYDNLKALISESRSSREYFFTLPTDVQLELSMKGELIRTADELHVHARQAEFERRTELLSRSRFT